MYISFCLSRFFSALGTQRECYSQWNMGLNFFNTDISLNMYTLVIQFYTDVLNIPLEGTVSQIFYLGLGFYFMKKNV